MNPAFETMRILLPEIILIISGFAALGAGFLPRPARALRWTIIGGGLLTLLALAFLIAGGVNLQASGLFQVIPLLSVVKMIFVFLSLFFIFSADPEDYGDHQPEFLALMQFATAGFMLLASATNLITIFLCLEFASICLYGLTALRADRKLVAEAAFKYFTFGATASAFLVFGMSLIYGLSGQTELSAIRAALMEAPPGGLLFGMAMIFILVGFGFKLALAPFHFWAPDLYQMAPLPVAGFIASVSNYAAFLALARILYSGLDLFAGQMALSPAGLSVMPGWAPVLALFAVIGIFAGNFGALNQTHLPRLMAYSAVAQGVFVLIAMIAGGPHGITAVFDYNLAYSIATAGVFLSLKYAASTGVIDTLGAIRARSAALTICLSLFLLSLAGVPPCVGFVAKFYVFASAFLSPVYQLSGLMWLVILGLAASALGFYYYLRVVKTLWAADSDTPATAPALRWTQIAPALLLGALVLLLGILPQYWLHFVHESIGSFLR
ncbi:NADH-quinone oxidoreductase subunit N [Oscillatoria laete-virens NRMC-F 0139]|nr:NADH-quinone oxidoreductase subunit N [Oscillatoria laete-virens]MDL5054726.1 NADH-quinone oxidoreductase subunit N [Oscillatoria laete-virens NRMC-F 0139]